MKTYNDKSLKVTRQCLRRKMPAPEIILWMKLKNGQIGYKFRRQHGIKNYIVDFYCPRKKLVIEIDGENHYIINNQEKDQARDSELIKLNIRVLRFTNKEIMENIDGVMDKIMETINPP